MRLTPPNGGLSARAVSKRFGALTVLSGVSIDIPDGQAVGIVGPNGAGKTTLLSVIAGTLPSSAGEVWFAGTNVTGWPGSARCRSGLVKTHQVPKPFLGMSVFENVLVGASFGGKSADREEIHMRAIQALERSGMTSLANRQASSLGLLDRKRLELARALATVPHMLLLDEIGGGLTDAETDELVAIVRALNAGGIGIVWIEHIVHVLVQATTRLVCMDAGRILADGTPEAVLANREVIEAYLGGGVS